MTRPKQRGVSQSRPRPTDKMLAFAQEFLRNGRRQIPAYRLAYNQPNSPDSEIANRAAIVLAHPGIAPIIAEANRLAQEAIRQNLEAYALSQGRTVLELCHLAFSNMQDYLSIDDETGLARIDLSGVKREKLAAIREFTVTQIGTQTNVDADGNETPGPPILKVALKLHEKGPNIERLAKIMGYMQPEDDGRGGGPAAPRAPNIVFQFVGSASDDMPKLSGVTVEHVAGP